ncbi:MAG: elongator complex protein 3 [Candidatus Electronema sp. V4]|uniref:elongator complex protein 3 n=1 Tax=Candidatus Electronema sp. V4 TaxID=3454756 RepID=UPI0040556A0C
MSGPLIIPIFISHEGCPHRCLFCNQHRISGWSRPVTPETVHVEIAAWLERAGGRRETQAAFYGGSFTALPRSRQEELLNAARPFVESGQVQSLRLSTRPDCIDAKQAAFLKARCVVTVELGAQSMNDEVLAFAKRGHAAADTERAAAVLRQAGLETGIQLLIGLPGDSRASLRRTVDRVIALRPDFVRLYPLLVVQNSGLADLHAQGRYTPLSLAKAVILTAFMKERFERAGIRVIRTGLQAGEELEASLLAGPWHPAFGELVSSRLLLRQTRRLLAQAKTETVRLRINPRDQSTFRGIKSANVERLRQLGLWQRITLTTDPTQERGNVRLDADSLEPA